jgi:hypothetical protein
MSAPAEVAGPACMRWSPGRVQSWRRPEDGGFDPARYGVAPIGYTDARQFCLDVHYAGTYPADRQRYGMFDLSGRERLVGVAVLSVPTRPEVLTAVFPQLVPYEESLDLGRFCLLDEPCPQLPNPGSSARCSASRPPRASGASPRSAIRCPATTPAETNTNRDTLG